MKTPRLFLARLCISTSLWLLCSCGGSAVSTVDEGSDVDVSVSVPDLVTEIDEGSEDTSDTGDDGGSSDAVVVWTAPDDLLRANAVEGALFAPIGISTAGYGQNDTEGKPVSPFADKFQATTWALHPPGVRVIHLLKGDQRVVFVQTDLVGIYYLIFEGLLDLVEAETEVDLRGSLVLMANHSHSGPGHLVNFIIGGVLADTYDEEIAQRVMASMAAPIIEALTTEAEPAKVGVVMTENAEMHKDRRCENPEYQNDTMGIIRIDHADEDRSIAVLVNYSMHGTVLSVGDAALSGDAPRAVEMKVREALPTAPLVMFVQSWAGDMAPDNHSADFADSPYPPSAQPKFDELEALGYLGAQTILSVWDDVDWMDEPVLEILSEELPLSYDLFGYSHEEFSSTKYQFGGAYCGNANDLCPTPEVPGEFGAPCDPAEEGACDSGLECKGGVCKRSMKTCIPVPEDLTITQTRITAVRLGDLAIVTLPGEPLTTLGEYAIEKTLAATSSTYQMVFGYAQDYTGYLLLPDDWHNGGYEAASNLWGPRQGSYLAEHVAHLAGLLFDSEATMSFVPAPIRDYVAGESIGYNPVESDGVAVVAEEPPSELSVGAELVFSWKGGDPWVDAPHVVVERQDATGSFAPYLPGGLALDERHYRVQLQLAPEPPWSVSTSGARAFVWTARLRTTAHVPAPEQALSGTLRVRVEGHAVSSSGAIETYDVVSNEVHLVQ